MTGRGAWFGADGATSTAFGVPCKDGCQWGRPSCRPGSPRPAESGPRFPFPAESGIGDSLLPGQIGNRGFPPRFPAKSGIGGTGIGDFRVRPPPVAMASLPPELEIEWLRTWPSWPSPAHWPPWRRFPGGARAMGLLQLAVQGALFRAPPPLPLPLPLPLPQPLLGRGRGLALVCTAPVRAVQRLCVRAARWVAQGCFGGGRYFPFGKTDGAISDE